MLPLFFFIILCSFFCKIVKIQYVTRHCDRTPISKIDIPYNPVSLNNFPLAGELTNLGIHQCYTMGKNVRDRYLDLNSENRIFDISERYNTLQYHFVSSFVNRAIQSCYAASFGYFPQNTKGISPLTHDSHYIFNSFEFPSTNDDDGYSLPNGTTPIGIRTYSSVNDVYLRAYTNCQDINEKGSNFEKIYKKWLNVKKEYAPFWREVVFEKMGFDDYTLPFSKKNIDALHYQYFFLERNDLIYNISLSSTERSDFNTLLDLGSVLYADYCYGTLGSGLTLPTIVDEFQNYIDSRNTSYRFIQYSAHDTTLETLYSALSLYDYNEILNHAPDFGSGLFFELHHEEKQEQEQEEYFIKLMFHPNYESTEFHELNIKKNNQTQISLNEFQKMIVDSNSLGISEDDWCHQCQEEKNGWTVSKMANICMQKTLKNHKEYNRSMMIMLLSLIILIFLTSGGLIICYIGQLKIGIKQEKRIRERIQLYHEEKHEEVFGDENFDEDDEDEDERII